MVDVVYDSSELADSTLMGLYPADKISLEDLLYGLMLPSGNDAALAIANHVAGSKQAFAELMNAKMKELDLTDSHFVNPHGLDVTDHYTSAYDLTMVSRYGMQNPLFRELAVAKSHPVNLWRKGEKMSYNILNLNRLLTLYPGADGIKIGFTENAGRTIVVATGTAYT
jgi:D-alanyl-D-alanine carboxypeptidase